jgi:hypothetical protein
MRIRGSRVSVDPSGLAIVTTDDVQAALAELDAAVDGLGGASALANLTDVDLTGQADGDFLSRVGGVWTPVDAPSGGGGGGAAAVAVADNTADLSVTSTSYTTVLSQTFTPSGTKLLCTLLGITSSSSGQNAFFRLLIGATSKPLGTLFPSDTNQHAIAGQALFTGLSAGVSVTVEAQVKVSGGTWQCRTSTYPDYERLSLAVMDAG